LSEKIKIFTVLGTRPEIIKLSPVIPLLDQDKAFDHTLIHTGQHYSENMNETIFSDLNLREPDFNLKVGSKPSSIQTAEMTLKVSELIENSRPDWILVQGDTNSTLAGGLAGSKADVKVAHIEAGARSGNKAAPEEINRILVDHLATLNFAFDDESLNNLKKENILENTHSFTNTGYEACLRNKDFISKSNILENLKIEKNSFILVTTHRAETVDNPTKLRSALNIMNSLSEDLKVIFPIHPRTRKRIEENDLAVSENLKLIEPIGYLDFLNLITNARFSLSDSGGIVDESVAINTPLFIFRNETERNEIIEAGKAFLVKPSESDDKNIEFLRNYIDIEKTKEIKAINFELPHNSAENIVSLIKNFK
jgi:UDP-N-acetylglucosamine 2-epimerase (non-hydrolysing)